MSHELGEKKNLSTTPELVAYYEDMPQLWRNMFFIAVCRIGWSVAFSMVGPLMVLSLLDKGVTEGYQATVNSVNLWALSFLVMYFSWKSDHTVTKMGRRKPYLFISALPIILATVLFPFFESLWVLIGLWVMKIFFTDIKSSTFPLLSIDCVRRDMLGRAQSLLHVATGIIMFLTMRFTPNLLEYGEGVPFVIAGVILTITTISAIFIKEPPINNPTTERFKPWSALKVGLSDRRVIWLMIGIAMIASFETLFISWSWIYAKTSLGLDRSDIFHALSWAQLVVLVLAFPTGWLIDRVGGFKVVVVYYVLMMINLCLLLNVHDKTTLAIYFMIMTIANPLNVAAEIMLFKQADPKDVGSVTSSNSFIRNFYNATLLFCAGWFIEFSGRDYNTLFISGAVLMTVGLFMFVIYRRKMGGPLKVNLGVVEAGVGKDKLADCT